MAAPSSGSADVETRCRLPLAVAAKPGLLAYWLWTFRDDSRRVAGPSEEPMAERRVDEPGLRLIGRGGRGMVVLSVGAGDGGSRRVASRVSRTRAHAGEFGFDTALGGNALAKRRPWRERADTEVGVARGIAARVRRETGEDVARLDVENVRTLNGTREGVATAAAWEERVNDGGLAFFSRPVVREGEGSLRRWGNRGGLGQPPRAHRMRNAE